MKSLINQNNQVETPSQERYDRLNSMSMNEIIGNTEELPLPDEVIQARKQKELQNNINYTMGNSITPPMGLNTESFLLPSKNMNDLYGTDFDGHFNLRMFTTREERIRLSSTASFLETMASILNGCISTTNGITIDTKLLTEFDFIYVMYMARIVSYGANYPITVTCPHCGKTYKYIANLDNLPVQYLDETFKEPFEIGPLPKSGDMLKVRLLRIIDRINIEKEAREILAANPNYEGDPTYNGNLEKHIVTVNGTELSPLQKKEYVENLSAYDNQYLQHKLRQYGRAGLDIGVTTTCSYCNKDTNATLSINSTFFRPEFDD